MIQQTHDTKGIQSKTETSDESSTKDVKWRLSQHMVYYKDNLKGKLTGNHKLKEFRWCHPGLAEHQVECSVAPQEDQRGEG
jgi:hypothetical protein